MPTVADILKEHVTLDVESFDRLYLNSYLPTIQTESQLTYFLTQHLLDNGFLSCQNPEELQKICEQLDHDHIDRFFRKWCDRLPFPLTQKDIRSGYKHELSICQMEFAQTQVFDRPLHGREFFESVIRENIDLGRPDRVQLVFDRKIIKTTPGRFRTRIRHPASFRSLLETS